MIQKDTEDWAQFLRNLNWSKQKSNRDVLCLKCWKIMKYEECVKHKMLAPDHIKSILTSKEYASEGKFIAVARAMGKVRYEDGDKELYENPYKTKDRRGRPPAHLSLFTEDFRRQKESESYQIFEQGGLGAGCSGIGSNSNIIQNQLYPGAGVGGGPGAGASSHIISQLGGGNSRQLSLGNHQPQNLFGLNPMLAGNTLINLPAEYFKMQQFGLNPTSGHHLLDQSRVISLSGYNPHTHHVALGSGGVTPALGAPRSYLSAAHPASIYNGHPTQGLMSGSGHPNIFPGNAHHANFQAMLMGASPSIQMNPQMIQANSLPNVINSSQVHHLHPDAGEMIVKPNQHHHHPTNYQVTQVPTSGQQNNPQSNDKNNINLLEGNFDVLSHPRSIQQPSHSNQELRTLSNGMIVTQNQSGSISSAENDVKDHHKLQSQQIFPKTIHNPSQQQVERQHLNSEMNGAPSIWNSKVQQNQNQGTTANCGSNQQNQYSLSALNTQQIILNSSSRGSSPQNTEPANVTGAQKDTEKSNNGLLIGYPAQPMNQNLDNNVLPLNQSKPQQITPGCGQPSSKHPNVNNCSSAAAPASNQITSYTGAQQIQKLNNLNQYQTTPNQYNRAGSAQNYGISHPSNEVQGNGSNNSSLNQAKNSNAPQAIEQSSSSKLLPSDAPRSQAQTPSNQKDLLNMSASQNLNDPSSANAKILSSSVVNHQFPSTKGHPLSSTSFQANHPLIQTPFAQPMQLGIMQHGGGQFHSQTGNFSQMKIPPKNNQDIAAEGYRTVEGATFGGAGGQTHGIMSNNQNLLRRPLVVYGLGQNEIRASHQGEESQQRLVTLNQQNPIVSQISQAINQKPLQLQDQSASTTTQAQDDLRKNTSSEKVDIKSNSTLQATVLVPTILRSYQGHSMQGNSQDFNQFTGQQRSKNGTNQQVNNINNQQ